MLINKLSLKNFRAVKDKTLEFQKGFNLITGDNGSGKSSVMQAFAYLSLDHTIKTVDDYINWDSTGFKTSTDIDYLGKKFDIAITRDGKKTEKKLYIDKDYYTNSDVTKELAEHFDPSFCKASFLAFQGEEDLITTTPAVRREVLKKIYDLTFLHQLAELDEEVKFLKSEKLSQLENDIIKLEAKDYSFVDYSELPFDEKEFDKIVIRKSILSEKIEKLKLEYSQYEEKKKKRDSIDTEIATKRSDSQSIGFALTKKRSEKTEATEEEETLSEKYTKQIKELESQLRAIVITRVKKVDASELEDLYKQEKELSFKVRESEKHLDLIKQGKCPTCGNEFKTDEHKLQSELIVLKDQLVTLRLKITKIETAYEKYEADLKQLNLQKNLKSSLTEKLANVKTVEDVERERLAEKLIMIEEFITDKSSQRDNNLESIQHLSEDRADIELQLANVIDYPNREIQDVNQMNKDLDNYSFIKLNNEKNEEHNAKLEARKREDENEIVKLKKDKDTVQLDIEVCKRCIAILKKDFPNHVIASMLGEIENGMNSFLDKTYKGRYTVAIEESKTGIEFLYGSKKASVILASGAEKQIMNVGMKVAFNKLSGMKILFLDEVDSQMSEGNSKEVFNAIYEMYQQGHFDQVFVITHQETTKELIENNFHAKVFEI